MINLCDFKLPDSCILWRKFHFIIPLVALTSWTGEASVVNKVHYEDHIDSLSLEKDRDLQGVSQKNGYAVAFSDGGNLHLWGLGRISWDPSSNNNKFNQTYFRFYFDGKKSEELMFRIRLDYMHYRRFVESENAYSSSDEADGNDDLKTVYFGRAYLSYRPKALEHWSFDIGRVLNQQYRYDVLGLSAFDTYNKAKIRAVYSGATSGEYDVGEGVIAKFRNNSFEASFGITYGPQSVDYRYVSSPSVSERFFYSGRIGTRTEITAQANLSYGVAASVYSHRSDTPEHYEVLPDICYADEWGYIFSQMQYRDVYDSNGEFRTSDYAFLLKNYLEVGTSFGFDGVELSIDSFIDSAYYDGEQVHNLGVESYLYTDSGLMVGGSASYSDLLDQMKGSAQTNFFRRISLSLLANKEF